MSLLIVSAVAIIIGIGGGMAFSKMRTSGTRFIIWGVITLFIFSWATMTLIGGLFTYVVKDGLAVVPFWIFGTPVIALIGIVLIIIGVVKRMKYGAPIV